MFLVNFERELPFSFSFYEAPAISPLQTNSNANNVTGQQVALNLRAFFFMKIQYTLYCYRLEFEQGLCFISCLFSEERKSLITDSIDQILSSIKLGSESYNKKLSHSFRSPGRIHAWRLRYYVPLVCAPYLKVNSLRTKIK